MAHRIGIVCGEFHRTEVEQMLTFATESAQEEGLEVGEVVWVPGSMEAPLAATRLLEQEDIDGVACLGIIEKGETQHGLAMGQAVIKSLIEAQLAFDKPVGLGIIGPGAEPQHIAPRLEPHAKAAVKAITRMLNT
ncbi:MAG TPA: 6,7-dimethyl-8-ribityllumazine synthase [Candidatus Thalassarchaeaceae archaeon]|jgi:6,7-dimethyl-8-ribityllumazine synthase|nr:6,7-dimethyl-8-ribityllumazine synthase [Candidatus Thalassarchaeaceae archaeon]MDP6742121.1 6,7-dimethyl-8-ribityllumazine synthase [Candidatus Thalassarchaeaceae archaeon]MDP7042858.1 6,7-dimethyl-8-ribityllumazine synthase [Candidatus Thalassarchaeaceae archaeon]DAC49459.1 MAG TPA: 6,7-dimethyl-8-ribityllumazine synthase [Candidatus Poseidoniales archaeon]HIH83324.1 6,7-dimethyl-8-ribityllumazine synthase [Candidatus Thalassarchaeaceae archaeon]|tara:strand:- start:260 stop:664 length:405 start_codon:yes stop_codon:yes gene_type:complete